jgi:hypothetical protein
LQHYSRLVHAANVDGHGYAFPYDDVTPDGGVGQEGAMSSPNPELLTVTVGGANAYLAWEICIATARMAWSSWDFLLGFRVPWESFSLLGWSVV